MAGQVGFGEKLCSRPFNSFPLDPDISKSTRSNGTFGINLLGVLLVQGVQLLDQRLFLGSHVLEGEVKVDSRTINEWASGKSSSSDLRGLFG